MEPQKQIFFMKCLFTNCFTVTDIFRKLWLYKDRPSDICKYIFEGIRGYVCQNILYSYKFYIYQKVLFIIVKDSSVCIYKNILFTMMFIYIRKLFIL